MPGELESTIRDNAQGPAKASGDSGSMEQHPLPDRAQPGWRHRYIHRLALPAAQRLDYPIVGDEVRCAHTSAASVAVSVARCNLPAAARTRSNR